LHPWHAGVFLLFFTSRRRHTRFSRDWSSDVCSSDLGRQVLSERDAISPGEVSDVMTISTPRGGQYRVVLDDGTEVWLNAESTLRSEERREGKSVEGGGRWATLRDRRRADTARITQHG